MIYPHFKIKWKNQKQFEQAPEIFAQEKAKALTEVGALLEREIRERTPTGAFGLLRPSVGAELFGDKVQIGTPLEYAEPVEYGSKPHWAPLAAIEYWAERKLGDVSIARKIWYSIAHKGTRPVLMFTRGLAMNADKVVRILEGIGDKIAARFNK